MRDKYIDIIRAIGVITIIILLIGVFIYDMNTYKKLASEEKPISYPEEIQAVRAGDTLYVSSVSDSIYIGFKQFKNK
jgi:hypothetical protein